MNQPIEILLVEDEKDVADLIALHLKRNGYSVTWVEDGAKALKVLESSNRFSLAILDWMLPGMSGLDVCKWIRAHTGALPPILMVTARADTSDIVLGLEIGADDYVTKPFEIPVLLARVRALLRRASAEDRDQANHEKIECGALTLRIDAHEVEVEGKKIDLTASEFKLLHVLLIHRGKVLSREKLIDLVRGEDVSIVDRAIDTHVFGLRKKLGSCADLIETIRGVGYRVSAQ